MAVTKVRDEQLKLDDVDQSVKLKNASEALRLESATPSLFLRETDQALADGLYKAALNGNELVFKKNTAVAGDFSTEMKLLRLFAGETTVYGRLTLVDETGAPASVVRFASPADQTTTIANSLFRASSDGRLTWTNSGTVNRKLAYVEDHVSKETPTGLVNGVNAVFTLAATPITGTEEVYLNGLLQDVGASEDYTISGTTITFNTAPATGDKLRVSYIKSS